MNIAENMILKSVGGRTQLRFTPLVKRNASDVSLSFCHAIIKLAYDRDKLVWAAQFGHYLSEALSAHVVRGLAKSTKVV